MSILITGGAGYIGSHLVKLLGEKAEDLIIIDNFSTGNKNSVLYGNIIQADLNDTNQIEEIFKNYNFDTVVHFAASIVVPESVSNPLKYYMNNTVNTTNLLNLCTKYKVNKFIFSSTAAVYGEVDEKPVSEKHPAIPINPYGRSKLMSEQIIKDLANANKNFKYVILRYFNAAGANAENKIGHKFPNATHLIKVAAETASGKRDIISIYGTGYNTPDGTCVRDYVHVDDLARAHVKAINYLNNNESDTFNCGYGVGYSVKEVIDTMKKVSGYDFKVNYADKRQGDPAIVISDSTKIMEKMGWIPKYNNLEYICQTALNWEKSN
ncbi:MAG: UDP-glucose 4-epimerase GalE [Bacteroidota bacterium]|nr:UDP-glucose 4-epimerase GalE [Bacteroidota bacterium]